MTAIGRRRRAAGPPEGTLPPTVEVDPARARRLDRSTWPFLFAPGVFPEVTDA
jgi:hypothetical protein